MEQVRRIGPWLLSATALGTTLSANLAAFMLKSDPALGEPGIGTVYAPWQFFQWAWQWWHLTEIRNAAMFGAIAGALFAWRTITLTGEKRGKFYRAARGGVAEAKKQGWFRNGPGIVLGKLGNRVARATEAHVLAVGATRCGKTASIHAPTLAEWKGAAFVIDPKAELYYIAARRKPNAFYFDPSDRNSARWNPIEEIEVGTPREVGQARMLADAWINAAGLADGKDPFWSKSGVEFLGSVILYVATDVPGGTLATVYDCMLKLGETIEKMERASRLESRNAAISMATMSIDTIKGIATTAKLALSVVVDPEVRGVMSKSDFKLKDIFCSKHPVQLFVQIRASDAPTLAPLQVLMLLMFLRGAMRDVNLWLDGTPKRHKPVLLLIEEARALGAVPGFDTLLTQMAEYGLRCLMSFTSISDVVSLWKQNQNLTANMEAKVFFGGASRADIDEIRALSGDADEERESKSHGRGGTSKSISTGRRDAFTSGEIRNLEPGEVIVIPQRGKPIIMQQHRWFHDSRLKRLLTNTKAKGWVRQPQNPAILKMLQDNPTPVEARIFETGAPVAAVAAEPAAKVERVSVEVPGEFFKFDPLAFLEATGLTVGELATRLFVGMDEAEARAKINGKRRFTDAERERLQKVAVEVADVIGNVDALRERLTHVAAA